MTDDLVKRLRATASWGYDLPADVANRIEELEASMKETEEKLKQAQHWIVEIRRWVETGEVPK